LKKRVILIVTFLSLQLNAQDISLFSQFNGHIDFLMVGNTLNDRENENNVNQCTILTSSSANLNLEINDYIEAAYLYWAGSGTGDFDVSLNGINLTSQRNFSTNWYNFPFFSAFADVTEQVRNSGNGNFTLADLDLNTAIQNYCQYGINFGGWAIVIVYSNDNLPLNQVNVYDGMQSVIPNSVIINLENLNVIDNTGAEVGFLAWEGDSALAVSEQLTFNGNVIGNPPLNPYDNAFNGTNSFTGASDLYNMDLDVYDIENYIAIGDTSATIELTSGQDFVMINTVVTKLNSQLPDAVVQLNDFVVVNCNERDFLVNFTVTNLNTATGLLPENTPISFYAFDDMNTFFMLQTQYLPTDLAVGESVNLSVLIQNSPSQIPNNFQFFAEADDDGNGNSTVIELNENNNQDILEISIPKLPILNQSNNLISCNIGYGKGIFDLSEVIQQITNEDNVIFSFFKTQDDLDNDVNELLNIYEYESDVNHQTIFIKVTNTDNFCFNETTVQLETKNCPPIIPQLLPNNTVLEIDTLYNIYLDFELIIYNRYGNEVFRGSNNTKKWDGTYKGKQLPSSTYFYIIYLNDGYFETLNGWIYLM